MNVSYGKLSLEVDIRRQTRDRHSRLTAILVISHFGLTGMSGKSKTVLMMMFVMSLLLSAPERRASPSFRVSKAGMVLDVA